MPVFLGGSQIAVVASFIHENAESKVEGDARRSLYLQLLKSLLTHQYHYTALEQIGPQLPEGT